MSYHQLTQEQRYQIYVLKKTGHTGTEIAEVIGVLLANFIIDVAYLIVDPRTRTGMQGGAG